LSRTIDASGGEDLADLPLRGAAGDDVWAGLPHRPAPPLPAASGRAARAAPLSRRAMAFAADAALVVLVVAGALLAAQLRAGKAPRLPGLPWAGAFAIYLSFFAVVLPLLLFGRTLGLALAGLRVRAGETGPRLTLPEAAARWIGTLATLVTLGLPLAFTARDAELPTPADRLSGRSLTAEEVGPP